MGVGEGVRRIIGAVETTSLSFDIVNYERCNPARMEDSRYSHLITENPSHSINLWHINADHIKEVMFSINKINIKKTYNIAFWTWELPVFPEEWCSCFDLLDEIWVPTKFVAESVRARTSKPVLVFPYPIANERIAFLDRNYFNIPSEACVFLAAYDCNSTKMRKNPDAAIDSFQKAFEPNDRKVLLIVKINNPIQAEIKYFETKVLGWQNIRLMAGTIERKEMDSLLNSADCFVSLHRSEGFGLAIAEAMILGKPVISTGWSGNVDFVTNAYPFSVKYRLVELSDTYGPYKKGQFWAEPNTEHASQLMKKLAENPLWAKQVATKEQNQIKKILCPKNIGTKIRDRVNKISNMKLFIHGK
jgi:glycosyltransferase involved in cell wall biosynthesis